MAKSFGANAGNWNDGTKWVGGVAPTSSDDVIFPAICGACTITATAACKTITQVATCGILTHNAVSLTVSRSVTLLSGKYTPVNASSSLVFNNDASLDMGGCSYGSITLNTAGKTLTITSALTAIATGSGFTISNGSVDFGTGFTHALGSFSSTGTNTRSITLGANTFNMSGTLVACNINSTNLTFSGASATINFLATNVLTALGGQTYGTVTYPAGGLVTISEGNTFGTLTMTGSTNKTDELRLGGNTTVTGTFTLSGNSIINRILLSAGLNATGQTRTLTITGATTSGCQNLDIKDMASASSWDISAMTGGSGDCGGNSNITFTTEADQHWTNNSGSSWSTDTNWTSRVPLPQDKVYVDNASLSASQTITLDMPRAGKDVSFYGVANTPTISSSINISLFGNLDLRSVGTNSVTVFVLEGQGSQTLTTAGLSLSIILQCGVGTYTCLDALTSTGGLFHNSGTLNDGGFNVTFATVNGVSTTYTRALTLTKTFTCTGVGLGQKTFDYTTSTGFTANCSITSLIQFTNTGATKRFNGGGKTYNNFQIASAGTVFVTGANTFNKISIPTTMTGNAALFFEALITQNIQAIYWVNRNGYTFTIGSNSPGDQATLHKLNNGQILADYITLNDSNATVANTGDNDTWFAGIHSAAGMGGNNTGWVFKDNFNAELLSGD